MLECFILFLLQSYFYIGHADLIDLGKVPFDGPKRGPEMTVEGGGNQGQQGMNSDRAKVYYVENINILQEDIAMSWPLGIVPYYFDLSSYDYVMNSRTREAMDIIEAASCVRFTSVLLKPDNNSWIHVTNPDKIRDCVHKPTYKGFEVIVPLGLECLSRREIVHTLLHAIGFRDEVTHPKRDQYIRVVWENIQPKYKTLFRRQPDEGSTKSLVEFDPMSIMQFHDRAFSRNGYATIAGLLPGLQIRPSEALSQLDKMKLRLLFGHECNRRSVDDLLDTCKREFRNDQPDNGPLNSGEAENGKEESVPKELSGEWRSNSNSGERGDNALNADVKPHKLTQDVQSNNTMESNNTDPVDANEEANSASVNGAPVDHTFDDMERIEQGPFHSTESEVDEDQPEETYENNYNIEIDDRIGTISSKRKKLKKH